MVRIINNLERRGFLKLSGLATLDLMAIRSGVLAASETMSADHSQRRANKDEVTLFLCGDVMTGRGIDQVLPHPSDPRLEESYVRSARDYVALAEAVHGPIPRPVDFSYIWGTALEMFQRVQPDTRIINLETSVTKSEDLAPKGINYRMNPENIDCLTVAEIECCALANNHVLDWGEAGLRETLATLRKAGLKTVGAGQDIDEAEAPAIIDLAGKGRVVVFAMGSPTSGIPRAWAAKRNRPGVNLLANLSERSAMRVADLVWRVKRPGDIVIASIHWGGNWGYEVPSGQRTFAHRLIDDAGVDVIHGHSSHHAKAIEVYRDKLILYGCGDLLTDYEGITGHEAYRDDLVLMYFPTLAGTSGKLISLRIVPLQLRRFQLRRPSRKDAEWLGDTLTREGAAFGTATKLQADHTLLLDWLRSSP